MGYLKSIDFDFRDLLYVNRDVYKRPLIPSVLWNTLENSRLEVWNHVLRLFRVTLEIEETEDPVHTGLGEYDEDKNWSTIKILRSKSDTTHNLIFQVIQTIMHEYIHASQAECNSEMFNDVKSTEKFEDYISEWREIQALAHCAYLEIMEYDERPTRTTDWYSYASPSTRKEFYKFIYRWYLKYNSQEHLNI